MQNQFQERIQARAHAISARETGAFHDESPLATLRSLAVMALICAVGVGFKALLLS